MKHNEKILRVFPQRTSHTPDDDMVAIGEPGLFIPECAEIHVSCTFTWDKPYCEHLAEAWHKVAGVPVSVGGPAYDDKGGEFTPGMYLRKGITITSRGCNNTCWFCDAWKREGKIRELEIKPGNIIQDNNLLQCSEAHIRAVFDMLKTQRAIEFTGGLDPAELRPWHVDLLESISLKQAFFANDGPEDRDAIQAAGKLLVDIKRDKKRCYVLIGHPRDTMEDAEKRLVETWEAGFMPFAMRYDCEQSQSKDWRNLQRMWARPAIIKAHRKAMLRKAGKC